MTDHPSPHSAHGAPHDEASEVLSQRGAEVLDADFPPDWILPPGDILQAELDARGLTQTEFAARTNLSVKHINQVIRGSANLSYDVAVRLERVLGTPRNFWIRLESNYQAHCAREKAREDLSRNVSWLRRFPIAEMVSRGILRNGESEIASLERLLAFFKVADPEAYEKSWAEPVAAGFRRTQTANVDPYATAVWLRLGERSASKTDCAPYDPVAFSQLLPTLPKLTLLPIQDAFTQLRHECAQVGVAVQFEPDFPGCKACGAARWINADKALILLSDRYRSHDIFWFAFFHEAAHLILHPRRRMVVDLKGQGDDADGHETAANKYAAEILIPPEYNDQLAADTTIAQATALAREIGIDPGIVAGRLSHQQSNWAKYARLRHKLDKLSLR